MTAPVVHYDALPTADKIRVNAAIKYSMSQDIVFSTAFLKEVALAEAVLNKRDMLPSFESNRNEAYQQVIDTLRSTLSNKNDLTGSFEKIPPAKVYDPEAFDLAAQQAVFRGSRSIKDPAELLKYMAGIHEPNVTLGDKVHTTKGTGYVLPLSDLEQRKPDAPEAVAFKEFMRHSMKLVSTQMLGKTLSVSGVAQSEGIAVAAAPSPAGERGRA